MVVMAVFWNNHFIRFAVWLLEKICCRVIILLPINVGVRILRKCGRSTRSNIWFQMVNIYMSMKFTLIHKKYFENLSFNSNTFSYPKLLFYALLERNAVDFLLINLVWKRWSEYVLKFIINIWLFLSCAY